MQKSTKLKEQLTSIIDECLLLTFKMPHLALSAAEAMKILDGLNTVDTVSISDRILMHHRLEFEINALEETEMEFFEKDAKRGATEREYMETRRALAQAEANAKAVQDERKNEPQH